MTILPKSIVLKMIENDVYFDQSFSRQYFRILPSLSNYCITSISSDIIIDQPHNDRVTKRHDQIAQRNYMSVDQLYDEFEWECWNLSRSIFKE